MKSVSEKGHAKNASNIKTVLAVVRGMGETYNPSNEKIQISSLANLCVNAEAAVKLVNKCMADSKPAITNREEAYKPLSGLTTRILNALKACGAPKQLVENAQTLVKKIRGDHKRVVTDSTVESTDTTDTKHHSTSRMSFDSRLDNFDKLINLLATIEQYTPNEVELTTESLRTMYTDIDEKNTAATLVEIPLDSARIERNKVLYAENTGVCDIAAMVKNYVKSVFGASSPEYKTISKIHFSRAN